MTDCGGSGGPAQLKCPALSPLYNKVLYATTDPLGLIIQSIRAPRLEAVKGEVVAY